jgi:hypothetical protein
MNKELLAFITAFFLWLIILYPFCIKYVAEYRHREAVRKFDVIQEYLTQPYNIKKS